MWRQMLQFPVCPSGPSMDGRARLDRHLWKIARIFVILPVYCDLWHVQNVVEL